MKNEFTKMWRRSLLLVASLLCIGVYSADASTSLVNEFQSQQSVTIRGKVVDATDGSPMIGVSVIEDGAMRGVVTDVNGSYSIDVPANAALRFAYIGYEEQVVPVLGSSEINVTMVQDAQMIDDVVVEIGYGGGQRKQDLSMSIATVKVDEVAKGRTNDLATVLQGQVPGMMIQGSGDPMRGASMNVRGRGSMGKDDDETSGTGVLVVVDGVPNAPYMVEDIETITVLKDAASSAIYGSQAGQGGVILITTKRASTGRTNVSVNVSNGVKKVAKLPEMLTSEQFNDVWRKASDVRGDAYPAFADPSSPIYSWTNVTRTNWLDEIFRLGHTQHYAVTVSGGSEKLSSLFSASYDSEDAVMINTNYQAFNARLNADYRVAKWLTISERASYQMTNGQGNISTGHQGPLMSALWMPRSATVYETDIDGNYVYDSSGNKKYGGLYPASINVAGYPKNVMNPVAELMEMRRHYPTNKLYSTTSVDIKPVNSFGIKSDFTAYISNHDKDEFLPIRNEPGSYSRTNNSREQEFNKDSGWLWETTATYANVFGKNHISAMLGYTMAYDVLTGKSIDTNKYKYQQDNSFLWDNVDGRVGTNLSEWKSIYAKQSVIGRVGYSYDDRYFATVSTRVDGSSTLLSGNRWRTFPAASASWKISSEEFMKDMNIENVLSLVKLRASWGRLGDVQGLKSHEGTAIPEISSYYAIFGANADREIYGSYYKSIANRELRWEFTDQWGIGLDIEMFGGRLDMSLDYYNKTTSDLIAPMALADQMGIANAPSDNIGTVNNKGWELSLGWKDVTKSGFGYNVWGMMTTNKSEVKKLGLWKSVLENQNVNVNSTRLIGSQVGMPLYSYYLYQTDGIFKSQEEIDNYLHEDGVTKIQKDAKPGDIKFVDVNGDGKINNDDRILMGNYQPKLAYSFGGSMNYKGFDFSVMFQGVHGNKVYNGMRQLLSSGRYEGGNLSKDVLNSFDYSGGDYPSLGIIKDDNGNFSKMSDFFLEDGSYLRLKNLTLGYTLPKRAMSAMKLDNSSIRIYFSADNLLTFTKYTGMDPEVGNFGVDRGSYPMARLFNFGININF